MDQVTVLQREQAGARSRGLMLRRLAIGCGAVALGRAAAGLAPAKARSALTAGDRTILELALALERLQAAFYDQALHSEKLTGEAREFAQIVGAEEHAHLNYLERELGSGAGQVTGYRFADAVSSSSKFVAAAVMLEETGLAAYNGQAENLSRSALGAVARVVSVEARHAAWARGLAGREPAPAAADAAISATTAMNAIRPYMG